MKKLIRIFMMAFLPFLLCAGMTLPVHAMSDEEKELFDMLGAEYILDENGDFKEFIANETVMDEIMSRFTVEQKMALARKYEGEAQVGKYQVCIGTSEASDIANIIIKDQNGKPVFLVDNCQALGASTVYINANQDFFSLHYEDLTGENLKSYTSGNMNTDEKSQHNPIEEYIRNEDGAFQLSHKRDDEKQYDYDENGELYRWEDFATGIIYDIENNPVAKLINTADTAVSVPYDVADEVQRLVDANDGSFNVYRDDLDAYITMPEIDELLYESRMAEKLGLTLEEYRKEHDAYEEYTSKISYGVSVCVWADILEVPEIHRWSTPEPLAEGEIPSNITSTGVAQELAKLINDYRVENGLNPLDTSDPLLQQVADLRAQEATYVMDKEHSRPMAGKAGGSFSVGENLAMKFFSPDMSNKEIAQILFEGWKKSEGHNANMLNKGYQLGALGVQFVKLGDGLAAYASHDFSCMSDYQNTISDTTKKRIEIGAQVPGNIESIKDYYLKLYDTTMPSNNGIIWNMDIETSEEETTIGSFWTTAPNGDKSIMQPLTGDAVAINGITPAIVYTQITNSPAGEQIHMELLDANYRSISIRDAFGWAEDIEHTKYKYVYFTTLDFVGDRAMFTVAGTDSPMIGNLEYVGEGTWNTENGPQTGPSYVDKGWLSGGY